jgi:hypothetical protein
VRRHGIRFTASVLAFVASTAIVSAQERAVVFLHGVNSGPETWQGAAERLRQRAMIEPYRPATSWQNSMESQADQVQRQVGHLPGSTIAVGHSAGGIVAREWSRQHGLGGLVTVGSPNLGAPIANHVHEWLGYNSDLLWVMGMVFSRFADLPYDQWWWVMAAVEASLNWGSVISQHGIWHMVVTLGLDFGAPFVHQLFVGSSYLDFVLNSGGNLSREAAQIPTRVGIVNTMSEFWRAGFWRLVGIDPQWSLITDAAAAGLSYWGFETYWNADPLDFNAQNFAFALWDAAWWLWQFDEFWCRATSDEIPLWYAHCWENDGFVATRTQFLPGAMIFRTLDGPVHTGETEFFDDQIYEAMTSFMHVPVRGTDSAPSPSPELPPTSPPAPPPSTAPPPPASGSPGTPTMWPGQWLAVNWWVESPNQRFYLSYQSDGNLVLYRSDGFPIWATMTNGTEPGYVAMQDDGNFVIYDGRGVPIWHTNTWGNPGAYLSIHDDGNMAIYSTGGQLLWQSGSGGY